MASLHPATMAAQALGWVDESDICDNLTHTGQFVRYRRRSRRANHRRRQTFEPIAAVRLTSSPHPQGGRHRAGTY
jgi:hypothetical protein